MKHLGAMLLWVYATHSAYGIPFDYPDTGSGIEQGCIGKAHCVFILPGAGNSTEADWRSDIDIITAHLPSDWGFVSHRPSPGEIQYTNIDINEAMLAVSDLGLLFNSSNLHVVTLSDGVRVGREIQQIGVLPKNTGLVGELDPLVEVSSPGLESNYLGFVTYWSQYPGFEQPAVPEGDFAYPIYLGPANPSDPFAHHSFVLGSFRDEIAELLTAIAREDGTFHAVASDHYNFFRISEDESFFDFGSIISQPILGVPGDLFNTWSPTGGGGLGFESFPLWIKTTEEE